jgi:hypothetical protein
MADWSFIAAQLAHSVREGGSNLTVATDDLGRAGTYREQGQASKADQRTISGAGRTTGARVWCTHRVTADASETTGSVVLVVADGRNTGAVVVVVDEGFVGVVEGGSVVVLEGGVVVVTGGVVTGGVVVVTGGVVTGGVVAAAAMMMLKLTVRAAPGGAPSFAQTM